MNGINLPLSHLIGLALLLLLALSFAWWSTVSLGLATTTVLLMVAVWEMYSLRGVRESLEGRSRH